MTARAARPALSKRALRLNQASGSLLYVFSLTAPEILQLADISRVSRDEAGELIGYQRPEVRQHVDEIAEYLDSGEIIFPNPIIIALPSTVKFAASRGPKPARITDDEPACNGMLTIPLPGGAEPKPGWIVDGQQRTLALARARRQDLPVLVTAFIADNIEVLRDQFIRINNTRPLPRGLVTELLPSITSPLPARLAIKQAPARLCDVLNGQEPFAGLIRRPSSPTANSGTAVIAYNSMIAMVTDSLTSTGGCLYPCRNPATGETDFLSVLKTITAYWTCVRDTFPGAWGLPTENSRLMHGAGIRAMGRLMDRIMSPLNPHDEATPKRVMDDLALIAGNCRWTEGTWDELGLAWNAVENTSRHISQLSGYLIWLYTQARSARR